MSTIEQSFSELRGVLSVATHRNFRRAATDLGVSASALSHAIANLEHRLGVRLFHRTTRSVSLSEAGARFVERIEPALGEIESAMESANDFRRTPRGTLRINTAGIVTRRLFEPLIVPYLARYPDVHLDIVTEGRFVDIVASGFDAGIRLAENVPRDMVAIPCSAPIRFVVVGSPEYFARHRPPRKPADLFTHRCIQRRLPSGAPLPWELERGRDSLVLDVRGPLTLDDEETVIAAALRGLGLAWVNAWSVESLIAEQRLVTVLDAWSQPFTGLALFYPPHRNMSAALRAFVDMIKEAKLGGAPGDSPARVHRAKQRRSRSVGRRVRR